MTSGRPKLKIPYRPIDITLELSAIALILLMWGYTVMNYSDLPDTIPAHFNGAGEIDRYDSKANIWLLPCISTVLFIGLWVLSKYPHLHNYMVNITELNAEKNYRFSIRLLRFVNLFCALLFIYINYVLIQSAFGGQSELGTWFLPVVISFCIILPIFLFIYKRRLNKTDSNG